MYIYDAFARVAHLGYHVEGGTFVHIYGASARFAHLGHHLER